MQSKLTNFERKEVWRLITKPKNVYVVGLNWFFKNKFDTEGNVVRDKERLVVKCFCQHE